MYKILYISRGKKLEQSVIEFAGNQSIDLVQITVPRTDDMDELKRMLIERIRAIDLHECHAIICRGSMEQTLKSLPLSIDLPIVSVEFQSATTVNMMANVLEHHPEEFEKSKLNVWVLSHQPVYIDNYIMDIVFHASVQNKIILQIDANDILKDAVKEKVDFLLCGIEQCHKARELGLHAYFDPNVDESESIKAAIRQALNIISHMKQQTERTKMIENIIDYSFEALLQINTQGEITYFNAQMQAILDKRPEEIYGHQLWEFVPELARSDIQRVIEERINLYGNIIEIRENKLAIVNLIPDIRNGAIVGAILALYEKEKIDSLDVKLNQKKYGKGLFARYHFEDILGESPEMETCRFRARQFARHHANILILGETGTGKELFAQSIHNYSMRREQPFVAINCGALPENLLESELFGYVGGAFTGANSKGKKGLIELADKGTIFLDEIGEMSLSGQVRLLRVIEERMITRIGDDRQIPIDVRIIAATNRNLYKEVKTGKFREDLYYRLNVLTLVIPPLRERGCDIELLAISFLEKYGRQNDKVVKLTEDGMDVMRKYAWPGNIRQLRNFCERLVIISDRQNLDGALLMTQLRDVYQEENMLLDINASAAGDEEQRSKYIVENAKTNGVHMETISGIQKKELEIREALNMFEGNKRKTAEYLGVSYATLWRKIKKYDIKESY